MKSYSQFVTESNEVFVTLAEQNYQELLDNGYTQEQISEAYDYYENLLEEGVITENPMAALGKAGGRLIPGLGTALYGMDAYNRFKKGDWGGGLIQGTGAALSAIPGVGGLASAIPAGLNIATDAMGLTGNKSKGQPGAPKAAPSATASKPGGGSPAPVRSTTSTTKKKPNSTVLALKGGVQGRLDKATGKFTAGNFSDAEKSRYTAAGGKIPSAKPTPSAPITGNKASNFMSSSGSKAAAAVGKASAAPVPSKSITGNKASSFMNPGAGKALAASPKPQMTAAGNKTSDLAALRAKAKNDTMARAKTQVSTPKMVGSARM
jgi:hypothetical protein